MRWGIIRLAVVGSAFLIGMLMAGYQNSTVLAPGTASADLSSHTGTSLVVTCEAGDPTVEHVIGVSGAVQVKCVRSHMTVTRFGAAARPASEGSHRSIPSGPIPTIPKESQGPLVSRTSS